MKFVHVGDLHLGKVIHQYSLLDIQRQLLFELLDYMNEQDIRILVIAGDVYDRLIPSQEAVNVLDEFLSTAIQKYHIEVLMISGNHDSNDRLHFMSSILQQQGLFIETYLKKEMVFVEKDDVRFYLLPFFKPSQVRMLWNEDVRDYQQAMEVYLKHQCLDHHKKNILVTHQFVGKYSQTSESEVPLSVGGSEIIDASLFDDFDYVALGHLHAPQKVSRETMRYSGSLMRYSFDEVKQNKSIVIVDSDDMSLSFYSLHPQYTLEKYTASYQEFMDPVMIASKEDILSFELTDDHLIPHAIEQLRVLYPHLLQITYTFLTSQVSQISSVQSIEQMNTSDLFEKFYHEVKNMSLSSKQKEIVCELLEQAGEINENH